jgi:hypothetical protein
VSFLYACLIVVSIELSCFSHAWYSEFVVKDVVFLDMFGMEVSSCLILWCSLRICFSCSVWLFSLILIQQRCNNCDMRII